MKSRIGSFFIVWGVTVLVLFLAFCLIYFGTPFVFDLATQVTTLPDDVQFFIFSGITCLLFGLCYAIIVIPPKRF